MASIYKDILISACPEDVWAAIRDVGAVHERLTPGVLTAARLEGDARIVSFANGAVVREVIVTIDDQARRLVYASVGGRASHHNASMQVFAEGANRSRIAWTTDLLPDAIAPAIHELVEQGATAMKQALESQAMAS